MNAVSEAPIVQVDLSAVKPTLIQARAQVRDAFSRYHSAVLKGKGTSAHLLLEETARATAALFGRKGGRDV